MYVFNEDFTSSKLIDLADLETFCPELSVRDLLEEFDEPLFGTWPDAGPRQAAASDSKNWR